MSDETTRGFPYPEPSDAVADLAAIVQALAQEVNDNVPRSCSGEATRNYSTGTESVAITFPAGRFTTPPRVFTTVTNGNPSGTSGFVAVWAINITTSGADLQFRRSSAASITASWHAVEAPA